MWENLKKYQDKNKWKNLIKIKNNQKNCVHFLDFNQLMEIVIKKVIQLV